MYLVIDEFHCVGVLTSYSYIFAIKSGPDTMAHKYSLVLLGLVAVFVETRQIKCVKGTKLHTKAPATCAPHLVNIKMGP